MEKTKTNYSLFRSMLNVDLLFLLVSSPNLNYSLPLLLLPQGRTLKTKKFIKLLLDKVWMKKKNCSISKLRCLRLLILGKISIDQENLDTLTKYILDTSGISKSDLATNPFALKLILTFFFFFSDTIKPITSEYRVFIIVNVLKLLVFVTDCFPFKQYR